MITTKIWTADHNWSKESKKSKSVDNGDYVRYYSPAKVDDLLAEADIETLENQRPLTTTFDKFTRRAFSFLVYRYFKS